LLQMGREGIARWTAQRIAGLRPSFAIELARLGVPQHEREAALVRTIATLQAVLDDPRGQWLFDPAQGQANGELALSALLDGSVVDVVLDRTFVARDGRRWIVDFKTSAHEGGDSDRFLDNEVERYRGQLETYARIWQLREPGQVWLGLYFPLLRGWREWVT